MDFSDPTKPENWRYILLFCALLLMSTVVVLLIDDQLPFNFLPWGGPLSLFGSLLLARWIEARFKFKK